MNAGDYTTAAELLRRCVSQMKGHNDRSILWWCLELLGWVAAEHAEYRTALRLIGAARTYGPHALPPVLRNRHDGVLAAARRALGATADRHYYAGKRLPLSDAIDLAAGIPVSPGAVDGPEALSEREHQVARLISQGRTNREIAATLVISTRTAEGHVQRILAKRGFTSRAQIAAWVTETDHDTANEEDTP